MMPVTPRAIHAPWRRSTRPTPSGVLTSLTTTMPSIASVTSRSTSRAGCSMPGASAPIALTIVKTTSTVRIMSVLWKASQPFVPPSLLNSRPSRRKKFSTGPWTSPMFASSAVATGAGAYQGRPSDARSPHADAMMNKTLERKPMVRMAGGSLSARGRAGCSRGGHPGRGSALALSVAECQNGLDFRRRLHRMMASLALCPNECQPRSGTTNHLSGGHSMKLKPLGDRLIVKAVEEEETTASGLVLPDTAKEKPQKGKVLAVGDGKLDDNGQRVPLDVSEGDEVLYSKYGGTEIKVDGEELLVLRESDVLAKVQG